MSDDKTFWPHMAPHRAYEPGMRHWSDVRAAAVALECDRAAKAAADADRPSLKDRLLAPFTK
jgi:hypothetical protein